MGQLAVELYIASAACSVQQPPRHCCQGRLGRCRQRRRLAPLTTACQTLLCQGERRQAPASAVGCASGRLLHCRLLALPPAWRRLGSPPPPLTQSTPPAGVCMAPLSMLPTCRACCAVPVCMPGRGPRAAAGTGADATGLAPLALRPVRAALLLLHTDKSLEDVGSHDSCFWTSLRRLAQKGAPRGQGVRWA